jgi:chromosome segregation ATPase
VNGSPSSVQIGEGSFNTDASKPTCESEKDTFVQAVMPETQELLILRTELKMKTDLYEEMKTELNKKNEAVETLTRQRESLREQINRVDKENIKLKKKID